VLIGHAGHPEVEGTMGQYDTSNGGTIYLVENEDDVARLQVKDPNRLAFVTQTTLSMDDTAKVIDALPKHFPSIEGPRKGDRCYLAAAAASLLPEVTSGIRPLCSTACAYSPEGRSRPGTKRLGSSPAVTATDLTGRLEAACIGLPRSLTEVPPN